jgi:PAS domain S-box-containing protein
MNALKKRLSAESSETLHPSTWPFRQVWENAVDGMRLTDELGLVQKVNQAYCDLVGKPRSELEGQSFAVIYASGRPASSIRRYRQHFAARTIKPHLRQEAVLWNGKKVWLELSNSFLEAESRSPLLFTILRDVSQRQRAERSLRQQHGLLQAIVERTSDAVLVKDLEGRYVLINPAGARALGKPVEEILGADDTALFSAGTAGRIMEADHQILTSGETHTYECTGIAPGVGRTYLCTQGVYRDASGDVAGLVGVVQDVTERRRAEALLATQQAAARALAESAALAHATPPILRAVGENLGWDLGALWEVDRRAAVLRCVAVWHALTWDVPEPEELRRHMTYPAGVGLPGHVWASGQPLWRADVRTDAPLAPGTPVIAPEGLHGAFAVPIRGRGETLGVLGFFSRAAREPEGVLLDTMTSIGNQIGQFMERIQAERVLDEREVEFDLAREIQQGLLPRAVHAPVGFEIGGASCPAHKAGGDYFDFIPMPGGYLGIVIGDASGHGVGAALVMAETRAYLRALALEHTDVRRIVTVTNRRLAEDIGEGHFVTLLLARLHPVTRSLVYSSAGHWPGCILDPQGEVKMVLHSTDGPLGLDAAVAFSTARAVMLEPGDLIFLHTDGVVEALAPDGALFGKERALRLVRRHHGEKPEAIIGALLDGVREFCGGVPTDDMTAIVIKVGGMASDSCRE